MTYINSIVQFSAKTLHVPIIKERISIKIVTYA